MDGATGDNAKSESKVKISCCKRISRTGDVLSTDIERLRRYLSNHIPCLRNKADAVYDLVDSLNDADPRDLANRISIANLNGAGVDVIVVD